MPATGVSGVDLYAISSDGDWRWCAGKYAFGDTIEYHFRNLEPNDAYHKMGREYRLYLPLYNSVKWLEVGVPDGTQFTPLPVRPDKPIVLYGTSIMQGACASRPGMAWPTILSRKLDDPLINLGFSGNGRLEPEVLSMVNEIDAKVFVLDCLPNLVNQEDYPLDTVKSRILYAVRTLRQKHPATPIVLAEHAGYTDAAINPTQPQTLHGTQRGTARGLRPTPGRGRQGPAPDSHHGFQPGHRDDGGWYPPQRPGHDALRRGLRKAPARHSARAAGYPQHHPPRHPIARTRQLRLGRPAPRNPAHEPRECRRAC